MNKIVLALSLTLISAVFALAQTSDYKKGEFYIGYSNNQVDSGIDSGNSVKSFFDDRVNFHGFNTSGVYNVSRYVGLKADVSGAYNSTRISLPVIGPGGLPTTISFDTKNSLYNVLGGVQVKDNASTGRLKPFAHALIGVGHARVKVRNLNCSTTATINCGVIADDSETGLAGAFGGGLDLRINDRFDFRLVQADYNPVRLGGGTNHNFRIGFGIVIK